ncbi:lysophospholipid acyltransferase family protein [soil metagenome]
MPKKPRNNAIDRLQYLGLRMLTMTTHSLPVGLTMRVAWFIGEMMYRFDKRHRDRAVYNLHKSFPCRRPHELHKLARISFRMLVQLGAEVIFTPRLITLDRLHRHIELGDIGQALRLMVKREEGVILLTGHYGNWEVLGYTLAVLGFETTSVARAMDNPYLNEFVLGVRQAKGQRIIDKKGAMAEAPRVLDDKGAVAFIADQDAGKKGMFVDFFGRPASTYKSIGLLAMRYEVPVVIGYARRVSDNFKFRLEVQDIIYPADWKHLDDPLRYITQRYTKALEDSIRGEPGQYLWLHRRWKSRPRDEAPEAAPR